MIAIARTFTIPPALENLPNAEPIARILKHAYAHPEAWTTMDREFQDTCWAKAWDAAWDAAMARGLSVAWGAAWSTSRGTPRGAILALVAWNDCAYLLDWPVERVRTHAALSDDPAAVLLLPAVVSLRSRDGD